MRAAHIPSLDQMFGDPSDPYAGKLLFVGTDGEKIGHWQVVMPKIQPPPAIRRNRLPDGLLAEPPDFSFTVVEEDAATAKEVVSKGPIAKKSAKTQGGRKRR